MNIVNLKVAILPLDIAIGDKDRNMENVSVAMADMESGTDLVVLPELFTTAFISDTTQMDALAEPLSGKTLRYLQQLAKDHNVAVAGSFLAGVGGLYYNRGFFIEPSGEDTIYDKKHMFSLSRECKVMTAGLQQPPVVRYRGWNLSMIICYDLRFPVWCRNSRLAYDAMIVPANWPISRQYAWNHLLVGRSIENQAYYIGANRSGEDEYGRYDDTSLIVDYEGKSIGEMRGRFVYATLDRESLETSRQRFTVWRDADNFQII